MDCRNMKPEYSSESSGDECTQLERAKNLKDIQIQKMQSGSSEASGQAGVLFKNKSSSAAKLGEQSAVGMLNLDMYDHPLSMKPSLSVMDRPNDK